MNPRRFFLLTGVLLAAGWLTYLVAGALVAEKLATRFGPALLRFGRGKFNDPAWFLQNRFRELLWLATFVLVWAAAHYLIERPLRSWFGRWRWTLQALAGFIFLNLWLAFAFTTVIFWGALGAGAGWDDYMRFQFKRLMAMEVRVPMRAVLVGNSQTDAQMEEVSMNAQLGEKLWTTELYLPSSNAYDLTLIEPQLEGIRPQFVICYLTEAYLYVRLASKASQDFFSFASLADSRRDGSFEYLSSEQVGYGLLGEMLPIFRCRSSVSERLLGSAVTHLPQRIYDAQSEADLEVRGKAAAAGLILDGPETGILKRSLEAFVSRRESKNCTVIFLVGGFNPLLAKHISPAIRQDMLTFLQELKSRHPLLIVVPPDELPPQTPADYVDLSHVNRDMQRRFTAYVTEFMAKQIQPLK